MEISCKWFSLHIVPIHTAKFGKSSESLHNFEQQLGKKLPIWLKRELLGRFLKSDFSSLIVPYHAANLEKIT